MWLTASVQNFTTNICKVMCAKCMTKVCECERVGEGPFPLITLREEACGILVWWIESSSCLYAITHKTVYTHIPTHEDNREDIHL